MTGEQTDRLEELRSQLSDLTTKNEDNKKNSQRDFLQRKYKSEVEEIARGSRLQESYNERTRRGQSFAADLSKYNEKQKAVVQKAIDSGILNNTNRTHELVDFIAKISADKGVSFDFTNNAKLKESGFAIEGKTVNGYITKDGIVINLNSPKVLQSTVGHEITHVLEGTELYTELQNAIIQYAKMKGDYHSRLDTLTELYEGIEGADVNAELTADLVGDYLFRDADFVNHLSTEHRNVFQKIYDEIKYLVKTVTAGTKEARELEKVKHVFEQAYKAATKNTITENGVTYALADIKKITPSGEQKNANIQEVAQMSSVYTVDESKLEASGKDFKEIYNEYFAEWGENIHSEVFGDISTKNSSVRSEIRHGSTSEKIAAVEAIPSVIENGKIVDWIEKHPGSYRIVVAAPIRIGNTPYVMGVMLQRDSQYQRLYLHDVVIEKETSTLSQDDLITTGSHKESDSLFTTTILQKILNVKKNFRINKEKSMSDDNVNLSLSENGEPSQIYGNFAIPARDLLLENTQEDIAPVQDTTQDAAQDAFPDDYAPLYDDEGATEERLGSLNESDVPPEMEAPYYGEEEAPAYADPFEDRDIKEVGNRKVKAYMFENPEVKPFFQEEANIMLGELNDTVKGEKIYTETDLGGVWTGTRRYTSDDIAYLRDSLGYTYAEIEKGLNAIIEDEGAENNAISKRIEFILNDRLADGYTDFRTGMGIPANREYINLLNEKQITDYSREAWDSFVATADQYEPPTEEDIAPVVQSAPKMQATEDIAPVAEEYEAITPKKSKPKRGNKLVRADNVTPEQAQIARVLDAEPGTTTKKSRAWAKFKANVLDKGAVFEDISLKTRNRELMGKWNYMLYSEARAQSLMGSGTDSVKSLNNIRDEVAETVTTSNEGNTSQTLTTSTAYYVSASTDSRIFGAVKYDTNTLGQTTSYFYDPDFGYLLAVIGADGNGTTYTYDAIGRMDMVLPAAADTPTSYTAVNNAASVDYGYDTFSRLNRIETETMTYSLTYDNFGSMASVSAGNKTIASYTYNANNGKLKTLTYGTGDTVRYVYDELDRIKEVWYTERRMIIERKAYSYTYDADGNLHKFIDNEGGQITWYQYDHNGRLKEYYVTALTDSDRQYAEYDEYDAEGRIERREYTKFFSANLPQLPSVTGNTYYTYGTDGSLTKYQIEYGEAAYRIEYAYDGFGRMTTETHGVTNSQAGSSVIAELVTKEYGYYNPWGVESLASLLVNEIDYDYPSTAHNGALTYTYDGDTGYIAAVLWNDVLQSSYVYDDLGQLTRENNAVLGATYVYTYDNGGNILSKKTYPYTTGTLPATATDTVTYGYDGTMGDLLTSYDGQTIPYDTNSLEPERWKTSVNTWILYWSQGRRLNSMIAPNLDSLGFLYNADGIRTSKTYMPSNQDWITHTYTLSGSTILTEEWTENNVDHTILYLYDANGAPLGMRYTNSTKAGTFENYLFVTNLQGDIIHIYDDAGTRLVTYNYDAWGNHTVIYENGGASTAARYNPFRYRGYYYDVETGLYYLNSRYYDPQVGRFINADSYVSTGQGLLGNNMFAYCGNNPINRVDPSGFAFVIDTVALTLGAVYVFTSVSILLLTDDAFTSDFADDVGELIISITNTNAKPSYVSSANWCEQTVSIMPPLVIDAPAMPIEYDSSLDSVTILEKRQGPVGKAGRKKQGREVNEKKRGKSNFKSRSNKDPNRAMKKHTPNRDHQKIFIPGIEFDEKNNQYVIGWC